MRLRSQSPEKYNLARFVMQEAFKFNVSIDFYMDTYHRLTLVLPAKYRPYTNSGTHFAFRKSHSIHVHYATCFNPSCSHGTMKQL